MKTNFVIDFDSTFVSIEVLEELGEMALEGNPDREKIMQKIRKTTALGMEGKIPFDESLRKRVALLGIRREHIRKMTEEIGGKVSASIEKNKEFFRKNAEKIFIISGGFKEVIVPLVGDFGISPENVFANTFRFDYSGKVSGVDEKNFLSQQGGKVKQIRALKFSDPVIVIGDGFTDWQIKKSGLAEKFVYFAENIFRKDVATYADYTVSNFGEFLERENLG